MKRTKAPSSTRSKATQSDVASAASAKIDARIGELGDWRAETLARVRAVIMKAAPGVFEEWKWDVPVWSHPASGIICTGETYKAAVKLTFAKGASLPDPEGLFNSSLEGKTRRAIDFHEGEKVKGAALAALIKAAVKAADTGVPSSTQRKQRAKDSSSKESSAATKKARMLSGGNPQIAKADGDPPVQAYISAMPGWKRALGQQLDSIVTKTVPGVRKSVKWNSPFYGVEGQGWFLSFHCFTKYVKVAFFRGSSLRPVPPGASKSDDTRYLDIREGEALDEAQFIDWVRQASRIPGWNAGR